MNIFFCLTLALSQISLAHSIEWTCDLPASGSSPTLFPDERTPIGVVLTAGESVLVLDGKGRILLNAKPGKVLSGNPVTVADLDCQGGPELLATSQDGTIVALDSLGNTLWSRDYRTDAGGFKSIVAADVHPHPGLEILFGLDDGWCRCLSKDGEALWSFFGDKFRVAGIAAGDVDNDGVSEVVYGTDNGHIYCLNGFGEVKWRFNEMAPYGRSGLNLADLNRDGVTEVLVTRSNVNNKTCLLALEGHHGTVLWRTQDMMQGYVSNAVADLDQDGQDEVLHADKGNTVYAEAADGTRLWQRTLNARGIFWAPAVADVDGDGQMEIVVGMRGTEPETGVSAAVLGPDGSVKEAIKIPGGANGGPCVGDMDQDGQLEVVVVGQDPNKVYCLSWGGRGKVAWPSLRGDSRMTGRSTPVPPGAPATRQKISSSGAVSVDAKPGYWGENRWTVSWPAVLPEGSFIEVSCQSRAQSAVGCIVDLKPEDQRKEIRWDLRSPGKTLVTLKGWAPNQTSPSFAVSRTVSPRPPDSCDMGRVEDAVREAVKTGRAHQADTRGLEQALQLLLLHRDALTGAFKAKDEPARIADGATRLREESGRCLAMADFLKSAWSAGDTGPVFCWEDANPWDPFDPKWIPSERPEVHPVVFKVFQEEFEDRAVTILNTGLDAIDVRCTFRRPELSSKNYQPEDIVCRRIRLHRCVPVPAQWTEQVFDALPEMGPDRSITIPPGESRQVWLVLDSRGLEPGPHELTLYVGTLSKPCTIREVPVRLEVWPIALSAGAYAKMNWTGIDPSIVSESAIQNMVEHGMSVSYGPGLPQIPVDAEGQLSGSVDWAGFDAVLGRVPRPWTFLWGGPPGCQWPEGQRPEAGSEMEFAGVKTGIQEMVWHLESQGLCYYDWAFYPIDEPWNTGFTLVEDLRRFAERVKKADPRVQMYADPAGLVRVEYLEEFKDLIDIWQPELNSLKRDPSLVEWFQKNARRFWAYEAPGPSKDLLPLGHYRAFGWYARQFKLEGSGYWVFKATDAWWPVEGTEYSAVYQNNQDVVSSRRWEADRDGVEDYRVFSVLDREIQKARESGHGSEADKAQALIDEALDRVIGWNLRNIDEITRVTREYEIPLGRFETYRQRIAEEILRLRSLSSPSP